MQTIAIIPEPATGNPKLAVNPQPPAPLLLDVAQTATRLNVSVVSVRKLIRQNRLKRLPDFRKVLVPVAEVERFASAV